MSRYKQTLTESYLKVAVKKNKSSNFKKIESSKKVEKTYTLYSKKVYDRVH